MRRAFLFIALFASLLVDGQYRQHFDTYQYNLRLTNPSFVGNDNIQSFGILYRNQWTKIDEAPEALLLSYENQISKFNSGVGLITSNFSSGLLSTTNLNLQFAYHFNISQATQLSFGLGYIHSINNLDISSFDSQNDDAFNSFKSSRKVNNMDVGISFQSKKFSLAVSAQNLFSSASSDIVEDPTSRALHLYAMYHFQLLESIKISPSFYYKNFGSRWLIDSGLRIEFLNKLSIGYILRFDKNDNFNSIFISELQVFEYVKFFTLLYDQSQDEWRDELGNDIEIGMNFIIKN